MNGRIVIAVFLAGTAALGWSARAEDRFQKLTGAQIQARAQAGHQVAAYAQRAIRERGAVVEGSITPEGQAGSHGDAGRAVDDA